ncbi:hypothetical protein [Anaeroselena agilis]|uniref:Uncharacterized protein n=1 Tax=Anaeroselena agilis TaxID=3063788 RepID=A0ABU3P0B6_9FIRM|nr:hypothetical protein [Selenomonadales bacterium 4137-cl]
MDKKTFWRLATVLALVTVAALLVHAGYFAVKSPPPAPSLATPDPVPPATPSAEKPAPAASGSRTGQMRLADKPEAFKPAPGDIVDYSYSLKKESNERAILPGVTVESGAKCVNIKTADKDRTIQIKRDDTHPGNGYQVMWQKKY